VRSGKTILLRDDWSDEAHGKGQEYRYVEFLSQIGQHLVHAQYYEAHRFILVDAESGKKTLVRAVPILAPGGERFACYDPDEMYGSSIEIWRIAVSGFEREWVYEPSDWVPTGLIWLNDGLIRISTETGSVVARRKGNAWIWGKPSEQRSGRVSK
jgi:hypothetical protein